MAFSSGSGMHNQHEALRSNADTLVVAFTATALLIFLSFCFLRWLWGSTTRMKLPPSPPGAWPIIGHLHLLGPAAHKSMAQLSQKYGPGLLYLQLGTKPHVVVSSPEVAKEIFKQHDLTFSHRPYLAVSHHMDHMNHGFAFRENNASFRKLRKIFISEMMSPKRRQQSLQIRAEENSKLLKSIVDAINTNPGKPIEIYSKIQRMMVDVLSRTMLSRRFESSVEPGTAGVVTEEEFSSVSDGVAMTVGGLFIGDYIPWLSWLDRFGGKGKQAAKMESRLQDIMTVILNEHRAKRKQNGAAHVDEDMVDVLLSHQEMAGEDSISEESVRAVTWDAFMGGTETAISVMEWALAHLVQDPPRLEKLKREIDTEVGMHRKVTEGDIPQLKYLQAVIKEAFRLHPPVPLNVTHQSHEPCTVGGYYIPAYTQVHVNLWGMGRDPSIWERPLEFYPERFLEESRARIDPVSGQSFELLTFGSGRRICPAASLGAVSVQLVVASIVHGFDLSVPDEIDMKDIDARLVIRMATPLQMHMQPRLPLELY